MRGALSKQQNGRLESLGNYHTPYLSNNQKLNRKKSRGAHLPSDDFLLLFDYSVFFAQIIFVQSWFVWDPQIQSFFIFHVWYLTGAINLIHSTLKVLCWLLKRATRFIKERNNLILQVLLPIWCLHNVTGNSTWNVFHHMSSKYHLFHMIKDQYWKSIVVNSHTFISVQLFYQ